jgi:hypothetical protein
MDIDLILDVAAGMVFLLSDDAAFINGRSSQSTAT